MFAVIKTGGKQYKVATGDQLKLEKLDGEAGDVVEFDEVLLVSSDKDTVIGKPLVSGAKVSAKIVEQFRDKKVIIFKKLKRKGKRLKKGHRQYLTRVVIESVTAPGL